MVAPSECVMDQMVILPIFAEEWCRSCVFKIHFAFIVLYCRRYIGVHCTTGPRGQFGSVVWSTASLRPLHHAINWSFHGHTSLHRGLTGSTKFPWRSILNFLPGEEKPLTLPDAIRRSNPSGLIIRRKWSEGSKIKNQLLSSAILREIKTRKIESPNKPRSC